MPTHDIYELSYLDSRIVVDFNEMYKGKVRFAVIDALGMVVFRQMIPRAYFEAYVKSIAEDLECPPKEES